MPRKDHLPRQTRQEHITLQPNRSIEFRVTDDFGSFSPPHWQGRSCSATRSTSSSPSAPPHSGRWN